MKRAKQFYLLLFLAAILLGQAQEAGAKKLSGREYDGLPAKYGRLNAAMDEILGKSDSASGPAKLNYQAYGLTKAQAADYIQNYLDQNTLLKYDPWFSFGAVYGAYDAPNLRWAVRPQIFIEGDQIIVRRSKNVKKLIKRCKQSRKLCTAYAKKNATVRDLISGGYSTKAFSKKLSAFLYKKVPYKLYKNAYSGPLAFFKRKQGDCTCVASLFIIFGRMAGAHCYITWDGFHAMAVIINGNDRFLVDVTQQTISSEIYSWMPQEDRARLDMHAMSQAREKQLTQFCAGETTDSSQAEGDGGTESAPETAQSELTIGEDQKAA